MLEPDEKQTTFGHFHLVLEEPARFGSPPFFSRNLLGLVAYDVQFGLSMKPREGAHPNLPSLNNWSHRFFRFESSDIFRGSE